MSSPVSQPVFFALGSTSPDSATALTTVDLSVNQTSPVYLKTAQDDNVSYQFAIESGTPTGTWIVETSNDMRAFGNPNSAKWVTALSVAFTAGVTTSGNNTAGVVIQNGWNASRTRWVASSGSGQGWAHACGTVAAA